MNTIDRIVQFATNPSVVRLSGLALTLVLGVVWGASHIDGVVWGD